MCVCVCRSIKLLWIYMNLNVWAHAYRICMRVGQPCWWLCFRMGLDGYFSPCVCLSVCLSNMYARWLTVLVIMFQDGPGWLFLSICLCVSVCLAMCICNIIFIHTYCFNLFFHGSNPDTNMESHVQDYQRNLAYLNKWENLSLLFQHTILPH